MSLSSKTSEKDICVTVNMDQVLQSEVAHQLTPTTSEISIALPITVSDVTGTQVDESVVATAPQILQSSSALSQEKLHVEEHGLATQELQALDSTISSTKIKKGRFKFGKRKEVKSRVEELNMHELKQLLEVKQKTPSRCDEVRENTSLLKINGETLLDIRNDRESNIKKLKDVVKVDDMASALYYDMLVRKRNIKQAQKQFQSEVENTMQDFKVRIDATRNTKFAMICLLVICVILFGIMFSYFFRDLDIFLV